MHHKCSVLSHTALRWHRACQKHKCSVLPCKEATDVNMWLKHETAWNQQLKCSNADNIHTKACFSAIPSKRCPQKTVQTDNNHGNKQESADGPKQPTTLESFATRRSHHQQDPNTADHFLLDPNLTDPCSVFFGPNCKCGVCAIFVCLHVCMSVFLSVARGACHMRVMSQW